jgi:agmatinase
MTKAEKIARFDPNSPATDGNGVFGLPFDTDDAEVVLLPVPWEVTVSYRPGTAAGPEAILHASRQVDLYDPVVEDAWKIGIAVDRQPEFCRRLARTSARLRKKAERYLEALTAGADVHRAPVHKLVNDVNAGCRGMVDAVKQRALIHLARGKLVGLIGGDHSTALGLIEALAETQRLFGILHIDAHADLREAYEGFEFSHASIMFNVLPLRKVTRLVQVGVRDYCEEEVERIRNSRGRVRTFFDRDLKRRLYRGHTFAALCADIVAALPKDVYLSFDIDGLDPKLCPHTGTPVAGGFETEEVLFLLEHVVNSGRRIIGFDLNEVARGPNDEWDANVAARLLYRIANLTALSNGRVQGQRTKRRRVSKRVGKQ